MNNIFCFVLLNNIVRISRIFLLLNSATPGREENIIFSPAILLIKIILLILILIISLFIVNRILTMKNEKPAESATVNPLTMKLQIKHPKESRVEKITKFPVSIGFNHQNSVELPFLAPEKRSTGFTIIPAQNNSIYRSVNPMIVNGVLRKKKILRRGDRITLQQYRIIYLGYNRKKPAVKEKPVNIKIEGIFLTALILLMFIIPNNISEKITEHQNPVLTENNSPDIETTETLSESNTLSEVTNIPLQESTIQETTVSLTDKPVADTPVTHKMQEETNNIHDTETISENISPEPETVKIAKSEPVTEHENYSDSDIQPVNSIHSHLEVNENTAPETVFTKPPAIEIPENTSETFKEIDIEIIAPGTIPRFYKADMLFIHAHPDDESLDFGGLIAKASLSGKRIAVIIFTDGESGLDRFPDRTAEGDYPPYRLAGSELSELRILECGRALSILGAETYIRLGLKNNPYTTTLQEKSIEEMLNIWGGEEYLSGLLQNFIEGYRPDIIISPDGPSDAHEHFEHEACGYIVSKTIERIRNNNPGMIKAYLNSVDPLQKSLYPDASGIDISSPLSDGTIPKNMQLTALYQHITQADASVIGIRVLSGFKNEYYRSVFWDLGYSIEEYLK
jgi:LmbE family N-acetylglucosaminyl deacetylase